MVASGTHVNSNCCFDFGNTEATNFDNHAGHMDAVNLSTTCYTGTPVRCCERERPGELVRVDVKKLGNIPTGRLAGRRPAPGPAQQPGGHQRAGGGVHPVRRAAAEGQRVHC